MQSGLRAAEVRIEAGGETADKWTLVLADGEDGGAWIASMDKFWIEPPRFCSRLLVSALSAVTCSGGVSSDSMQRLSTKLIKLPFIDFLAGISV